MVITCREPDEVLGSIRQDSTTSQNGSFPLETELSYYCTDGYSNNGGNLTRICLSSGTWSGESPFCKKLESEDDTVKTLLIAAGCIVLACLVFFALFSIDFYRYRKKKSRSKDVRTRGLVQKGTIRPTSFIISKANLKLMPFYMSHHYKEPNADLLDKGTMRYTLDSDMSKVIGGVTTDTLRSTKESGKKKKKKKTLKTEDAGLIETDMVMEPDNHLQPVIIQHSSLTRSLPLEKKKKKKKRRQVEPIDDDLMNPLSQSLNGTYPMLSQSVEYPLQSENSSNPQRASKYQVPKGQHNTRPPEGMQPSPEQSSRPLPPLPRYGNGGLQQQDEIVTMPDETVYRM